VLPTHSLTSPLRYAARTLVDRAAVAAGQPAGPRRHQRRDLGALAGAVVFLADTHEPFGGAVTQEELAWLDGVVNPPAEALPQQQQQQQFLANNQGQWNHHHHSDWHGKGDSQWGGSMTRFQTSPHAGQHTTFLNAHDSLGGRPRQGEGGPRREGKRPRTGSSSGCGRRQSRRPIMSGGRGHEMEEEYYDADGSVSGDDREPVRYDAGRTVGSDTINLAGSAGSDDFDEEEDDAMDDESELGEGESEVGEEEDGDEEMSGGSGSGEEEELV
jgi:hypothetical protein